MLFEVAVAVMMALAILWYIFASRNPSPTADPNPSLSPSPTADPSPRPSSTADPSPTDQPSQDQEMTEMQVAERLKVMISCKCAYACNDKEVLHLLNKKERGFHDFKQYQLSKEIEACGAKVRYFISRIGPKELIISISVKGIDNISDKKKAICLHPTGLFEGCVSSIVWELANLIPWVYLLEVFRDSELVISGHYIGGAVAQLVTVLMKCHLRQNRKGLDGKKIRCITFGAPRFAYDSFTAFTKKIGDDVSIENVGVQDDDGWIEEIVPQQCSPIQQVIAGSFTGIVNCVERVAQVIGDTGIRGSEYATNVAKVISVLSVILQLDKDGVVGGVEEVLQAYGDTDSPGSKIAKDVVKFISAKAKEPITRPTPVLLGQEKLLIEATDGEVSKSRTANGKLFIDAYLSRMKNHFHRNLRTFDPTDVQPEYLLDPQLHLDAEYHEGILQMEVTGEYDVLDLDTFAYSAAQPKNVKLMEKTKTETELTLKVSFPLDPEVPIEIPVYFTCETHFGDELTLTVPYDTKGLFCSCMKSNGNENITDVVMKAIERENLVATYFHATKDEKSELMESTEKLIELIKGSANEKQQTDDVKLLASHVQEKIRSRITIRYNRTMFQKFTGFVSTALSATGFGAGASIGLDIIPPIAALASVPVVGVVVGAGAIGVAAGATAIYVTLRKETVAEQYRAVLISILKFLFDEENTSTSCNCKLEEKMHEMAKREKVIRENMLSINEEKLKKRDATITNKTRSRLSKRLHAVCIIRRIKEILLRDIFIFVVGQQNHGKTTLVQRLTGEKGQPADSGYSNLTDKPTLYKYTVGHDVINLVDMPATTAIAETISNLSTNFGKSADLLVWVFSFNGKTDRNFEDERKHILSVGRPVLLCFSKCMLAASDPSMKNGGNIADLLPNVEDVPNVEAVIPMELTEDGQKVLANKKIIGVQSSDDVGKWIFKWKKCYLKTQMQCKF